MNPNSEIYRAYVQTLKEELIPAMGCTEPIAIAYAAAKAREVLGCVPDMVKIGVSNNIIKNVKSVIVPNTGGMKGIEAAAVAGGQGPGGHLSGQRGAEAGNAGVSEHRSHCRGGH